MRWRVANAWATLLRIDRDALVLPQSADNIESKGPSKTHFKPIRSGSLTFSPLPYPYPTFVFRSLPKYRDRRQDVAPDMESN